MFPEAVGAFPSMPDYMVLPALKDPLKDTPMPPVPSNCSTKTWFLLSLFKDYSVTFCAMTPFKPSVKIQSSSPF